MIRLEFDVVAIANCALAANRFAAVASAESGDRRAGARAAVDHQPAFRATRRLRSDRAFWDTVRLAAAERVTPNRSRTSAAALAVRCRGSEGGWLRARSGRSAPEAVRSSIAAMAARRQRNPKNAGRDRRGTRAVPARRHGRPAAPTVTSPTAGHGLLTNDDGRARRRHTDGRVASFRPAKTRTDLDYDARRRHAAADYGSGGTAEAA